MCRSLDGDAFKIGQVVQLRAVIDARERSLPFTHGRQESLGLLQTIRVLEHPLRRLRPGVSEALQLTVDFVQALNVILE
ncbi:MAG: hypothetical protein ACPHO4_11220, partial [Longimicrobiales bacterium]